MQQHKHGNKMILNFTASVAFIGNYLLSFPTLCPITFHHMHYTTKHHNNDVKTNIYFNGTNKGKEGLFTDYSKLSCTRT